MRRARPCTIVKSWTDVLDPSNTGKDVWADSAYRSVQIEAGLKAKGFQSRIHRRAARNHPLSERQKSANTPRSKVRARVEHVFGQQQNSMGGKIVRTIGIVRARFKIGMMNLSYNIRRLVQLERRVRVASCKGPRCRPQASKTVPIGDPPWHEHCTRSLSQGRNRRMRLLFEVPFRLRGFPSERLSPIAPAPVASMLSRPLIVHPLVRHPEQDHAVNRIVRPFSGFCAISGVLLV
jgi:hypothetical protein